jgi:hypothetical protein
MGRVESEQAVVHYPSDPLHPLLGYVFRHHGPIYQFHHVYIGFTFRS